jgi:nucleoid-associated protein YgaU
MSYAVFFSDEQNKLTLRLPVNPEEITYNQTQNVDEIDIFGIGGINIPRGMKPIEISFESEFPSKPHQYVETPNDFKDGEFYIRQFTEWRNSDKPIRYIVHDGTKVKLNILVIIEDFEVKEKAGEEGDYYISFGLKQYKPYGISTLLSAGSQLLYSQNNREVNPPNPKSYTIKRGDTLYLIAKRFLGDGARYPEIHSINIPPLQSNPNLIHPDQVIKLP